MAEPGNIKGSSRARRHGAVGTNQKRMNEMKDVKVGALEASIV
jgi:hypothetical protein